MEPIESSSAEEKNIPPIPTRLRSIFGGLFLAGVVLGLFSLSSRYFIFTDGAVYATLGKNLAEGIGLKYCGGTHLFYPPGYPLVISSIYLLCRDAELSAHLVSFLAYLVSVFVVFRLAWAIRPTTLFTMFATTAVVFHPYLILYSSSVMSESLLVCVVLTSSLCTWKIATHRSVSIGWWCFWGLLGGYAYLIRADGLLYWPLQAVFIAAYRWKDYRQLIGKAVLAAAIFIGVMLPYLILIKNETGLWQLSTKTSILINFSGMKMNTGGTRDETRHTSKLSADGKTFAIDRAKMSLGTFLIDHPGEAMERITFNIKKLVKRKGIAFSWTNVPVLALLVLTLRRRIVSPKSIFILVHLLPVSLFLLMYLDTRFLLAFIPFFGLGFSRAAEEFCIRGLAITKGKAFLLALSFVTMTAIGGGLLFGPQFVKVSKRVFQFDLPYEHKAMGIWMKQNVDITPTTRITHRNPWVSFYAGGCHKRTPFFENAETPLERAERLCDWCRDMGVEYLVADERMTKEAMSELAFLLEEDRSYPGLIRKHTIEGNFPKIVLYAIQPES